MNSGKVSKPWGPWIRVGQWFDSDDSEWYPTYMPGIITKDTGPNSFYFASAGQTMLWFPLPRGTPHYFYRLGQITLNPDQQA